MWILWNVVVGVLPFHFRRIALLDQILINKACLSFLLSRLAIEIFAPLWAQGLPPIRPASIVWALPQIFSSISLARHLIWMNRGDNLVIILLDQALILLDLSQTLLVEQNICSDILPTVICIIWHCSLMILIWALIRILNQLLEVLVTLSFLLRDSFSHCGQMLFIWLYWIWDMQGLWTRFDWLIIIILFIIGLVICEQIDLNFLILKCLLLHLGDFFCGFIYLINFCLLHHLAVWGSWRWSFLFFRLRQLLSERFAFIGPLLQLLAQVVYLLLQRLLHLFVFNVCLRLLVF